MHWSFKLLFVSPAEHLWQTATLMLFASGFYLCTFLALVLYAGDPSLGFIPHTSQEDPTGCLNILPVLQLPPVGAQPALSCLHGTPYQSGCAEAVFSVCGYKASLLILFNCLFQAISPQFSCNSRFFLGGG